MRSGKLKSVLRRFRMAPYSEHPGLERKSLLLTEAGVCGFGGDFSGNATIDRPEYGIDMADLAVQASASRVDDVLAWMLDDNSHQDFSWGIFSNKEHGMKLRPWFYPWALLSRFVPSGSNTYRTSTPSDGVCAIVARIPREKSDEQTDWTYCIVNRTESEVMVSQKASIWGATPPQVRL